jgi:uncharacterized Zn finger protein (UPF0148 family)
MKIKCKMCGWFGIAPVIETRTQGVTMRIATCPKCAADLFTETVNGDD